jgi:hypothetical protein
MHRVHLGLGVLLIGSAVVGCGGDGGEVEAAPVTTVMAPATTTAAPDTTATATSSSSVASSTTSSTTSTSLVGPWTIPEGEGTRVRGMHIGGNWGTNPENISVLPDDWFEWLNDMNAAWVGISISLYVTDPRDSTVSSMYEEVRFPTFTDDELRVLIDRLHEHGFQVYLTLAFEENEDWPLNPRWAFGDPAAPDFVDGLSRSDWRWDPAHPEHDGFVAEFWDSYTAEAVHYAELAEREGVSLFSLGTETDHLFNVSPTEWTGTEYRDELMAMVEAVRDVYTGRLTYDQSHFALEWFEEGWVPGGGCRSSRSRPLRLFLSSSWKRRGSRSTPITCSR